MVGRAQLGSNSNLFSFEFFMLFSLSSKDWNHPLYGKAGKTC